MTGKKEAGFEWDTSWAGLLGRAEWHTGGADGLAGGKRRHSPRTALAAVDPAASSVH